MTTVFRLLQRAAVNMLRHVGLLVPIIDRIIRLGGSSPKAGALATTLLATLAYLEDGISAISAIPASEKQNSSGLRRRMR